MLSAAALLEWYDTYTCGSYQWFNTGYVDKIRLLHSRGNSLTNQPTDIVGVITLLLTWFRPTSSHNLFLADDRSPVN